MTTDQVEFGGIMLSAGTPVTLCIGAANRDPRQFTDPETLDIGRTPNRHLAFATGAHQCAGMALARLEGAIAISRFLARFPDYALNGPSVRGGRVRFRGFPQRAVRGKLNHTNPDAFNAKPACPDYPVT
jgi:cytochrome P450